MRTTEGLMGRSWRRVWPAGRLRCRRFEGHLKPDYFQDRPQGIGPRVPPLGQRAIKVFPIDAGLSGKFGHAFLRARSVT